MSRLSKLRRKSDIEYQRKSDELDKVKIRCKCGHRVVVPMWVDKSMCTWCKHYVYRNKQLEFRERLKQKLKESRE